MAVLSDPISDFLIRFKNACRAGNEEFTAPHSRMKADIASILQEEGYIWKFEVTEKGHKEIRVMPKYVDGRPVLTDLKRVSRSRPPPLCRLPGNPTRHVRPRHLDSFDLERRDVRRQSQTSETRRRGPRLRLVNP